MSIQLEDPVVGNYFVSTYPPFSVWKAEEVERFREAVARGRGMDAASSFGLYVHLPFCPLRCDYCYYLSYAEKSPAQIDVYLDALIHEARIYGSMGAFEGRTLEYVYFGGGTPSHLSAQQIERAIRELQAIAPWDEVKEATFECAPNTVTEEKLRSLKAAGITRLSMGVQQMNDEILRLNGRVHLVEEVERAYAAIQKIGFDVVNLDLMAGLVGETDETFFDSLDRIIEMAPDSVTIYPLEIPMNTPLFRDHEQGRLESPLADWDVKRARLREGFDRLSRNGYTRRSAYAAVRDPSRHRFLYQELQYRGGDLLGLGVASFSYWGGVNHQNLSSLTPYLKSVDAGALPLGRAYALNADERYVREFVLQLKLGGADAEYFHRKFGLDFSVRYHRTIEAFVKARWLTLVNGDVKVTDEGLTRVDRMIPEFYPPEHSTVRYS